MGQQSTFILCCLPSFPFLAWLVLGWTLLHAACSCSWGPPLWSASAPVPLLRGSSCCGSWLQVTWKSKIKAQFPNPNDYSAFMGDFSTATGAVTFTMMIISRFIFNKFGWGVAALITPTVLLLTGAWHVCGRCSLMPSTST